MNRGRRECTIEQQCFSVWGDMLMIWDELRPPNGNGAMLCSPHTLVNIEFTFVLNGRLTGSAARQALIDEVTRIVQLRAGPRAIVEVLEIICGSVSVRVRVTYPPSATSQSDAASLQVDLGVDAGVALFDTPELVQFGGTAT
eukprot:scaffold127846_cov29-Prasinocladus_malaysianus.AAC.1